MDLQDSWLSTIMAYEHLSLIRAGCCVPDGGCLHHRESNACPDGYTRYRSHSAGCRGCRAAHGNTHPDPGHWRHRRGPGGGHARRHPHADTCANRYSDADTRSNPYPTIDSLFHLVQHAITNEVEQVTVSYNSEFGYPTNVAIDSNVNATDTGYTHIANAYSPR